MLPRRGQRGCLGKELVKPALGVGRVEQGWRWSLTEVCSQDRGVFPGHQRAQPPFSMGITACSASEVGEGGFALAGKEQLSLLMSLKGRFLTPTSSTFSLGPAVLCGSWWWSFLPGSSFFRQPSQLYQNILTSLA